MRSLKILGQTSIVERLNTQKKLTVFFADAIAVVVLIFTRRHNTMQSVVAGQDPKTLEGKNNTHAD